jgi:hypothetical protein
MELPDQPGRAQGLRRACHRLFDHRQGAGRNAGVASRTDEGLCRRRRAGRRDRAGLRQSARSPSPARRQWANSSRPWPAST